MNEQLQRRRDALLDAIENAPELHPALTPWVMDTGIGLMVKHPFVFTHLGGVDIFNKQANDFYAWKIKARRSYLNKRNWYGYLMSLERPYRMLMLERLWTRKRITRRELRRLLIPVWTDTEMPQENQAIPVQLFRVLNFTTDSYPKWKKLPEEITVYRGVEGMFELTADGPSWTTDLKTAKFFAYRFGAKGCVYRYTLKKPEARAYIVGRDEAEIILDFGWLGESSREAIEVEEGDDRPEFRPWH